MLVSFSGCIFQPVSPLLSSKSIPDSQALSCALTCNVAFCPAPLTETLPAKVAFAELSKANAVWLGAPSEALRRSSKVPAVLASAP